MPPVALTEAQAVIFFLITIVSSYRVMSRILIQIGENYEVNISSEELRLYFF